jgi:histidine ammonia-lyase
MNDAHYTVNIDGKGLTIDKVVAVARDHEKVEINETSKKELNLVWGWLVDKTTQATKYNKEIEEAKKELKNLEKRCEAENGNKLKEKKERLLNMEKRLKDVNIYGVTTGFGALKDAYCTSRKSAEKLQENIVLSHACGVGDFLDEETTRAAMLVRANTLASGYCGVRVELVQRIVNMLNANILPLIPEQGSVGASGDLAPLAHMSLPLLSKGAVKYKDKVYGEDKQVRELLKKKGLEVVEKEGVKDVLKKENLDPNFKLSYKEGLALLNGDAVMTAIALLTYWDSKNLIDWADAIGAMTLENILGSSKAFNDIVFYIYHHSGAHECARFVRDKMIIKSTLINKSNTVHDSYSIRCIPQVHGYVRDEIETIGKTIQEHLNTVSDDPVFFKEGENGLKHFEVGHFQGDPIAFTMDKMGIVIADIGTISERRIQMLLDPHHNRGLPAFLVDNTSKVNSGYMIAQYTAAALVSENKIFAHPASVDSVPTSANTEDYVSMGTIAARKARKIVNNVRKILAIELLCATEALSYRIGKQKLSDPLKQSQLFVGKAGEGTTTIYNLVRDKERIPLLQGSDKPIYVFIEHAEGIISRTKIEDVIGK